MPIDPLTSVIQKLMTAKEIDPACPCCGSMEGKFRRFLMPKAATDDWAPLVSENTTVRVLSATCENCGSMRLFQADILGL